MVPMQDTDKIRAGGADQSQVATMRDGGDDVCAGGLDQMLAPADKSLYPRRRGTAAMLFARGAGGDQRLTATMRNIMRHHIISCYNNLDSSTNSSSIYIVSILLIMLLLVRLTVLYNGE